MPARPKAEVTVAATVGGMKSLVASKAGQFGASACEKIDLSLPEALHIQSVRVRWRDTFFGDSLYMAGIHLGGQSAPQSALSIGATSLTVGIDQGVYYTPTTDPTFVEFWNDADDDMVEIIEVDSVAGDIITLKNATLYTHSTSATVRCIVSLFHPLDVTTGQPMGFEVVDNGTENFPGDKELTNLMPAGLVLAARGCSSTDVGTRTVIVTYRFKRPTS